MHGDEVQGEATERARLVLAGAVGGEEGRVFHAAGFVGAVRRHHRGGRAVGISPQRLREVIERVDGRLQHRFRVRGVVRGVQHADLHRPVGSVPGLDQRLGVAVVGGPGEVVDVVLHVTVGDLAGLLHRRTGQRTGRPHGVALGHGQAHVVAAEVGVELAVQVELVGVPARGGGTALARQFQHRDLGEPLRDQVEGAVVAGARDHPRQLVEEVDVERGGGAGRDRARQVDADHAAVGLRAAVRLDEGPLRRRAVLHHLVQADEAEFAVLGIDIAAEAALAGPLLGHEGAAGALEAVEVHVHVQAAHRLRAAVAPGQRLFAGDGVLDRVEFGIDRVRHRPVRQRRFLAGARAAPGIRGAGHADRTGISAGQRDGGACAGGQGGAGARGGSSGGLRGGRQRPGGAEREQQGGGTGAVHGLGPAETKQNP